ncbi:hypothetical protein SNEBB_009141 [Seison nebaliae]|nr:hypothetical protein SNEBB_009141 [Seison nebaliae]
MDRIKIHLALTLDNIGQYNVNRTCKFIFGFCIISKPAHLLKNWILIIIVTSFEYLLKSFQIYDFMFDIIKLIIKAINGDNLMDNTQYFSNENLSANFTDNSEKQFNLKDSTEFNYSDPLNESDDRFSFRSYPQSTTDEKIVSDESLTKDAINFSKFFPENKLHYLSSVESMETKEEYEMNEVGNEMNSKKRIMSKTTKRKISRKLLDILKKPKSLMSRLSDKIKLNEKLRSSRDGTAMSQFETTTEHEYHRRSWAALDWKKYRSIRSKKIISITDISNIIHRRGRLSRFLRKCRL